MTYGGKQFCRVLRLLEQLTAQVPLTAGSEFVYTGLMFSVAAEEISMADSQETGYEMDFRGSTSISLPESLFRGIANVTQNSTFRITRAAFENGSIFPSPELAAELGGAVIAASVVGYPVDNLQDPVVLTFPKNEVSLPYCNLGNFRTKTFMCKKFSAEKFMYCILQKFYSCAITAVDVQIFVDAIFCGFNFCGD